MKRELIFVLLACICSLSNARDQNLQSLCDKWNILGITNVDGYERFHTFTQQLATDTIIGNMRYLRLEQNNAYLGALREGDDKDIYYIPNGTNHEYLLYAFNASAGDRLSNLWYGGDYQSCPYGYSATIKGISESTPKVFTIEVEYPSSDFIIPYTIYWTEGIGMADGPTGQDCPGPMCEGDYGQQILCAYKNGEQVYASEYAEQYGCKYNYDPLQDIETVMAGSSSATKIIRDRKIYIRRGEKEFTLTGQETK